MGKRFLFLLSICLSALASAKSMGKRFSYFFSPCVSQHSLAAFQYKTRLTTTNYLTFCVGDGAVTALVGDGLAAVVVGVCVPDGCSDLIYASNCSIWSSVTCP